MKLLRTSFSLRSLLIAITAICIAIGVIRYAYGVDQKRVRNLGPTLYSGKLGEGYGWTMSPHVYGAYKWTGPRILEIPMRKLGIPWFDRFAAIIIVHDKHVTHESAAALANSKYIKAIEIRTKDPEHKKYVALESLASGRIAITYVLVDHD